MRLRIHLLDKSDHIPLGGTVRASDGKRDAGARSSGRSAWQHNKFSDACGGDYATFAESHRQLGDGANATRRWCAFYSGTSSFVW